MGGAPGPLDPQFPRLYRFFNVSLKPHGVAAFTGIAFLFFSQFVYDTSGNSRPVNPHTHVPKDLAEE